ncbi:MAG TPA: prolipoprotein diacylglyceryl transferase family protein [Candidatus Limnocylindrales bacterium]|jgi:phosphatidylglycerol:prolipoprotein diacylglycerol transferase|nr:prolipoprotein diacylglyceryl transferase family protein [Candidatus Limnocylindrales bacterium]
MIFIPSMARGPLHVIFELLGYLAGSLLYIRARQRSGDFLPDSLRSTIVCAAFVGAALGSRLLACLEHPQIFRWHALFLLDGGRTIVGGVLGGWIAVEAVKHKYRIQSRTGDLFVTPLIVGLILGRIGCFFAGTADDTFGRPTTLPWGIDFGDGLARHPLQLYEILFLLAYILLSRELAWPPVNGDRFRLFVFSYFSLRFGLEFMQDSPRLLGLDALQWACLAGALWCAPTVLDIIRRVPHRLPETS